MGLCVTTSRPFDNLREKIQIRIRTSFRTTSRVLGKTSDGIGRMERETGLKLGVESLQTHEVLYYSKT